MKVQKCGSNQLHLTESSLKVQLGQFDDYASVRSYKYKMRSTLSCLLQFPDQLSPFFFVGKYPTECGKYPRLVLMVAVVEFDGRMTYRRKDHRLALLLVPYFFL